MRIWLAYKFRGRNLDELRLVLADIRRLFQARGHQVVTMIEDIQNWDWESKSKAWAVSEEYRLANSCDLALCIYESEEPSEGRGWDAGFFAGMGKPTVMAIKRPLTIPFTEALFTENPANAQAGLPGVIRYDTFEEIAKVF
ncbi:MAG: hypothetical protein WCW31_00615 [Patescibacteria group bacterium]|jgi:hypothetical protein